MINDILKSMDEKMKKATEITRNELVKIRTGKATTALLDGIKVEYYGQLVPLSQCSNVSVTDIHTISVTPWDKATLSVIEKAIQVANLGMNPIPMGTFLKIPIPPLNEERRKELGKLAKKFGEDGKIAIRNIRRDAIEHIKKS